MTSLYELHIYTAGSRNYAEQIAKILDPDQAIFKERILSRDDTGDAREKSLRRLFPCDQSMVVVVDDNYSAWRKWKDNLIQVQPCKLSTGAGDINSAQNPSRRGNRGDRTLVHTINPDTLLPVDILSQKLTESTNKLTAPLDRDGELFIVYKILEDIHKFYYRNTQTISDIRNIIPSEIVPKIHSYHAAKQTVLQDCHILFSKVIPIHSDPSRNHFWTMAEQFGAKCYTEINDFVTHVVANEYMMKTGTAKTNAAKKKTEFKRRKG
ncbi:Carboxy-terminal domain (CTD) phosphatase [Nowakowskiella sp. JEL0078]|nr:Carboxy-terminal domain (CTD) phosphatase [Nowakowskiella sp. JEL0078]